IRTSPPRRSANPATPAIRVPTAGVVVPSDRSAAPTFLVTVQPAPSEIPAAVAAAEQPVVGKTRTAVATAAMAGAADPAAAPAWRVPPVKVAVVRSPFGSAGPPASK